jgi:alkanesulfonate monooxygenase SsuD/methylene tetrahydromethanopterin reductase-like flavin-dependent oxidoreductase (luciferase family)/predicted kinase
MTHTPRWCRAIIGRVALPDPAFVWLLGPSGSGKSTWAASRYRPEEIVSSDELRGRVGSGRGDLRASADAFAVLEMVASARLRRGFTVVVDTLGFDAELRARLEMVARAAGVVPIVVAFEAGVETCLARNATRAQPLPASVIRSQFKTARTALEGIAGVEVMRVGGSTGEVGPADRSPRPGQAAPRLGLRFYLHVSRFDGDPERMGLVLREMALAAETAGFTGLSLMDHLRQIPQVGRSWDPSLDPFTTLAHLSAVAPALEVGVLVTPVTFRNVVVLAKAVATLDVLSGGRSFCGLGAGWYAAEHQAAGLPFPAAGKRLDLLEDSIGALRALLGPGTKPYQGSLITLDDTTSYPRPLQERLPILVGGGGRRRMPAIVARHADRWNLPGGSSDLVEARASLHDRCRELGRDPSQVEVSVLDQALVGSDRAYLADLVERWRGRLDAVDYARRVHAGTVDQQVERYRRIHEAGADAVFVVLPDLESAAAVERFTPVISALAGQG